MKCLKKKYFIIYACFFFLASCSTILESDIFGSKIQDFPDKDIKDNICSQNELEKSATDLFFETNLVYKVKQLDDILFLDNNLITMKFYLDENFVEIFMGCTKYKVFYIKNGSQINFDKPILDDTLCPIGDFSNEDKIFFFILSSVDKYLINLDKRKAFLCTYFNNLPIELTF